MIHRIIGKYLRDSAEVRNRVGVQTYAEHAPERTTGEHLIISEVSGDVINLLTNEAPKAHSMVQINCYADKAHKARELYELVRNRLSGFKGNVDYLDDDGTESTTLLEVQLVRKGMEITDPEDASDNWKYAYSADFSCYYTQTAPTHT